MWSDSDYLIDVIGNEPAVRIESANPASVDVMVKDVIVEHEPANRLLALVGIVRNSEVELPRRYRLST